MKRHIILFIAIIAFLQKTQAQYVPSFVKDSLDTYFNRALEQWKIPGAAICIVKDGKVVVMKGYGLREAGGNASVDENTLFMIGSNTKAFTATALAMLDASGKLSLDDKVQQWLPDFKLHDPWVAGHATIRDLLSHRLGFETFQGDFMYFDSDLPLSGVREKMGKLKPVYDFRSRWGYTNAAFLTAGEIIPKVTGRTWQQFIRDSIFVPLGMTNSLAMSSEISAASNRATAHTVVQGVVRKIPYGRLENMGPAGSISSSVNDMSRWLLMQLSDGRFNNRQVVHPRAIAETRTPASILGRGWVRYNTGHYFMYGLGWFLQEYAGREVVSHTGGVNGFVTSVTLIPEERLGIVVLTNSDANEFFDAVKWDVMDAYLNLPYRNYSNDYLVAWREREQKDAQWLQLKKDTVAMRPTPSLPPESFIGTYRHEVYGTMIITLHDKSLVATFEHHKGRYATLGALGGNRFLASFNEAIFGNKVWPFTIANGKVKSVTVTVADFVEFTPYEFVKIN